MKRYIVFAVFSFVFMLTILSSCKRSVPAPALTNSPSLSTYIQSEPAGDQSLETEMQPVEVDTQFVMDDSGIAWIVEPTLEYEYVFYCLTCGYTANFFTYVLNESTGQIDGNHLGHGGFSDAEWLYDSENGMIGIRIFGWDEEIIIHAIDQFSTYFSYGALKYARQIDSANIIKEEHGWYTTYILGEKYENSKYAIMYGSTLLTDFIYDRPDNLCGYFAYKNAIPVSREGKWGFINTMGDLIIPLIFDHAASSNGEIAFVKINGKYGIIDVRSTIYR
jgi:hypothetical protein